MSTIANNVRMHQALSCSISDYLVPVLILTSISSLFLFSSNNVSASDSYVDNISLTVPISCSLGGTVNTEHTATLQNMTNSNDESNYTNGIGKTTLTAFCNDINGFSIYAVGFTGDTDTGTTNNKLVGINTNSTIDTKVYSSGDTTSSWSMKVTKVANSEVSYLPNNMTITNSYDNWHIVPSTYDKVATYKAESGSSATDKTLGAKLETTYAVYIGHSQLADTYQGKVKYVLVNPYNAEEPLRDNEVAIVYDGNNADNPNGMGTTLGGGRKSVVQTKITEDTKVTLLASNFKRDGYGFVGWSTDIDAWTHFTDNDNTNDPIIYGPMEDVIVDTNLMSEANDERIITMHAVWVPAKRTDPTDPSSDPVYLQEWDDPTDPNDGCVALAKVTFNNNITNEKDKITVNKNSIIALTDKRDNMVYAIAKLADNNCWMIENLRLDNQYTMGQNQNDNTVTNESLAQGYGGTTGTYGNFVGLASSESANFSNSTTSNSVYKSSLASPTDTYDPTNNVLEDIGSSNSPGYRFPRYNNNNTSSMLENPTYTQNYANASSPSNTPSSNYYRVSNLYSYGNYYTWAAAMANTNSITNSTDSEAAGTSICPAGWHLPSSSTTTKEFGALSQGYGGSGNNQSGTANAGDIMNNRFRSFPNNFLYSGYFSSSSAYSRGTEGLYWSRSALNINSSYILGLGSTDLYPSGSGSKGGYGRSVRCLIGS